jgi:molybdate transport system ATP-binding protein
VTDVDERGHRVRVSLAGPIALVAEITQEARRSLVLAPGKQPWVSIKATEITVYPA